MRIPSILLVLIAAVSPGCGGSTPSTPSAPSAARGMINVRVPAAVPARVCPRCGDRIGEMEAVVDMVIEETGGVGGEVTGIGVHFLGGTTTIEGPGVFDREVLLRFGAPTLRIAGRGSLTIPAIGVHFEPSKLDLLPGTLRFAVMFRDDNGNSSTTDVSTAITR